MYLRHTSFRVASMRVRRPSLSLLSRRLPTHEPLQGSPTPLHTSSNCKPYHLLIRSTSIKRLQLQSGSRQHPISLPLYTYAITSPQPTGALMLMMGCLTRRHCHVVLAQSGCECAGGTRLRVTHDIGAIATVVGVKPPHKLRAGGTRITLWWMVIRGGAVGERR